MLRTFALAVLLIVMALPVTAGFKEGVAAYNRGDYMTAFREFKAVAEQGLAVAQYNLGVMYEHGKSVPNNNREAVKWYRKAAVQGYADAQFNLGLMYMKGRGVPKNYLQANKWWSLLAARGDKAAAKHLNIIGKKMSRVRAVEEGASFRHIRRPNADGGSCV